MLLKEILNVYDLLDSATANGDAVANYLKSIRADANVEVVHIDTPKGSTDVVRVLVAGTNGRSVGGSAPTIGLMGWLGGIGARPGAVGYVSDGDGALVALAIAVMIGDGCCAFVSISLGQNVVPKAKRSVGNAVVMCLVSSIVLAALYLIFED